MRYIKYCSALGELFSVFQRLCFLPQVLIVDDSKDQRDLLRSYLMAWGYPVDEATNAKDALRKIKEEGFSIVISDWMMPEMSGIDLCQSIRALPLQDYCYMIIVSGQASPSAAAKGISAGADDFLAKPFHKEELKSRLSAGCRILDLDKKLKKKTLEIEVAYRELRSVYSDLQNDLKEAGKFQDSLVPEHYQSYDWGEIAYLYKSCGHVGGDLVGHYWISPTRVGIYSIDVSGHGMSSALLAARLAAQLRHGDRANHIAFRPNADGGYDPLPPHHVARALNNHMFDALNTEHYFTMALADCDLETGYVQLVQAGHPPPIIFHEFEGPRMIGEGGLPIGLLPHREFEQCNFYLEEHETLLLYSDGLTECSNREGEQLEEEGLMDMLEGIGAPVGMRYFDVLLWSIGAYTRGVFDDDISAVRISVSEVIATHL